MFEHTTTALPKPLRFPDEITTVLLRRIESGEYTPGSKLPSTREFAQAFNVSPPMVREALSRLKHDGYVEARQGSGVFVSTRQSTPSLRLGAGMTADQALLADTYEVRLHVEQSCAELAALRRTNENLIEMRLALDEMAEAVKNHTNGTPADVRFHLAIARATHNEAMLKLLRFLHGSLEESVQLARVNSEKTPGQPQKTQLEHQSIYAAIEAADPLAARLAVKAHLDGAANRLGLRVGPHPQADVQSKVASDRQENK